MTLCICNNHGQFKRHSPWLLTSTILCVLQNLKLRSHVTPCSSIGVFSLVLQRMTEKIEEGSLVMITKTVRKSITETPASVLTREEKRGREKIAFLVVFVVDENLVANIIIMIIMLFCMTRVMFLYPVSVLNTHQERQHTAFVLFFVSISRHPLPSSSSLMIKLRRSRWSTFFASPSKTWSEGKWKRQEGEKERKSGTCLSLPKRFVCPFPWKTRSRWL